MKGKFNIIMYGLILLCIIVVIFLFTGTKEEKKELSPTITFNGGVVVLKIGETKELKPVINNISNYTLSWNSSNPNVATVNNGIVNAVSSGNANITATIDNYNASATMIVIVNGIDPESIKLDKNELELYIDEESTLNYTLLPDNATNKEVTWEVSNDKVLSINQGYIKPLTVGEAYVIVKTNNGLKDSCKVTIRNREVDVTSINFDKDSYTVYVGDTLEIKATVSPDDATNKTLTWTSSDTSIAIVKDGIVTPKKKGNVTIFATDSKGKVKKSVNVNVNKRTVNVSPKEITIIGDSRMVGLCGYKWYKNEGGTCIAKSGMGYSWLTSTAIPTVNTLASSKKKNIVLNLGVNDLGRIDRYIEKYKELFSSTWKNYHIFLLSVNPTSGKRADMNTRIISFNSKLKSSLSSYKNVTYCDSYNYLKTHGFQSGDGVHYRESTSKDIYEFIKKCVYNYYNG